MRYSVIPVLLLLLSGCVPDETHETALMRVSQLENQLSGLQSILTTVEVTLVIVAAMLALCMASLWRLSRKGGP